MELSRDGNFFIYLSQICANGRWFVFAACIDQTSQ